LKTPCRWLIEGGGNRTTGAVTRACSTGCGYNMLERKREKIWKSLRH
jgi:hypothetical protein